TRAAPVRRVATGRSVACVSWWTSPLGVRLAPRPVVTYFPTLVVAARLELNRLVYDSCRVPTHRAEPPRSRRSVAHGPPGLSGRGEDLRDTRVSRRPFRRGDAVAPGSRSAGPGPSANLHARRGEMGGVRQHDDRFERSEQARRRNSAGSRVAKACP